MQLIPKEHSIENYAYTQVWRDKHYAIYEQRREKELMGYEVFKITVREAERCFGKEYPKREVLPYSEQWGSSAFTVKTIEEAKQCIEEMREKEKRQVKKSFNA